MELKIHIPTYKRANNCITVELLHKLGIRKDEIFLHVWDKEVEGYKRTVGEYATVLPFPFHKKTEHLNYILEHADFKNEIVLIMDDDIKRLCKFLQPTKDKPYGAVKDMQTREDFIEMIEHCTNVAEENGLIAWSIVPSTNKLFIANKTKGGLGHNSYISGALCCYRSNIVMIKDSILEDLDYVVECAVKGYDTAYIGGYCYENLMNKNDGGYQSILASEERTEQWRQMCKALSEKYMFVKYQETETTWKKWWLCKRVKEYLRLNNITEKFVDSDGSVAEKDNNGSFRPFL